MRHAPLPQYTIIGPTLFMDGAILEGQGMPPSKTPESILRHVAEVFDVTLIDLKSDRRHRAVSWPRFAAMYAMRHLTTMSYPRIGKLLGDRDHTSIIHGVDRAGELMGEDDDFRSKLALVMNHGD